MTQALYVHTLGFSPRRFFVQGLIRGQDASMILDMDKVSHFYNRPKMGKGKAMRRIETLVRDFPKFREVAIFWDSENQEYQIRIKEGENLEWNNAATYYTDENLDAVLTARRMLAE